MNPPLTFPSCLRFRPELVLMTALALCAPASAADLLKANNTNALNLTTSWVSGTVPGSGDVAVWDNTVTAANTSAMGGNLSFDGIRVTGTQTGAIGISTTSFASGSITANASTDTLSFSSGTVTSGDVVTFGGTMPTGMQPGRPYYVVNASGGTYQISDSPGGTPINFTTAGSGVTHTVQSVLALGGSGITIDGNRNLASVGVPIALSASQTWSVGTGRTLDNNNNPNNGGVLVLNNGYDLTIDGGGRTEIGSLVGAGGLVKNGAGHLLLQSGVRYAYSGDVFLNSGTVTVANANATSATSFGTGTVNFGTGASDLVLQLGVGNNGLSNNYDNNVAIHGNVTASLAGSASGTHSFRFGTLSMAGKTLATSGSTGWTLTFGATTLTGSATFNVTDHTLILGGVGQSGGARGITKAGNGVLQISGNSSYTGATAVTAGSLVLTGSGSINSTSGVSVSAGASFTNSSSVTFTRPLTLAEGSTLSGTGVTGDEFAPSALTITADLSDDMTTFALADSGFAKGGNLELTLSNITVGTYTLFTGTALSGAFTGVSIGGTALASLGGGDFAGAFGDYSYSFTGADNSLEIALIPEPDTFLLLISGLGSLHLLRRRRTV